MFRMPFAMINDWRALSLRRWSHLQDMKRSGRWGVAFSSEAALDEALEAAEADARVWKQLAEQSQEKRSAGVSGDDRRETVSGLPVEPTTTEPTN
jgi:hypothetical protein